MLVELGAELRAVRKLRRLSLAAVAERAKISATYLQKLEAAVVRNPSPRVLQRLAEVLDVSYLKLMELAGYLVPELKRAERRKGDLLWEALRSERLSEEERRAVVAFIAYLKDQRPKT